MAMIENLSHELLVEIFSYYIQSEGHEEFLKNIPRVCKAWNYLSTEAPLWRDVESYNWNFLLNVSRRGLLLHTQSLEVHDDELDDDSHYDETFTDTNLWAVLTNIRDLKAIDLKCIIVSGNYTIMIVSEKCPHLERLRMNIEEPSKTISHEWNHFLTVCGPTLKHLDLGYFGSKDAGQQLVSSIAMNCPLLERLKFCTPGVLFPIYELRSLCPRLRELEFTSCHLVTAGSIDLLGCGFKELKKFSASFSDFNGLDICSMMKNSINLENLELRFNKDLVLGNISEIPSDKVRILRIMPRDPNKNLNLALREAVLKWKRTLTILELRRCECDANSLLMGFLHDNPNPQLEILTITDNIDPHLCEEFIKKCQNLTNLEIYCGYYQGREKIKEFLESLKKRNV